MSTDAQHEHSGPPGDHAGNAIHLPAPTQWPLIMAVGLALLFAGLVTNIMISGLGVVMAVAGAVGWFRQVLPHEAHEMLPVTEEEIAMEREGRRVTRVEHVLTGRGMMPVSTYPISSGIKGGFAGGTVMIVLAEIYGVVRFHSIWYVVNLLGGAGGHVPSDGVPHCDRDPHRVVVSGGATLWRVAADHAATSYCAGWADRAGAMDWPPAFDTWVAKSVFRRPHQLVLVCTQSGGLRSGGGLGGGA
jgi:hypothetical protein